MKRIHLFFAAICFFLFFLFTTFSSALDGIDSSTGRRTALVIGNGRYSEHALINPPNDARDVGRTLEGIGFDVISKIDASREEMEDAVHDFWEKISSGGVGLFYFSGHGFEIDSMNYLLPVDAVVRSAADIKRLAVPLGWILDKMKDAGNGMNIVILDACRNRAGYRSVSWGLSRIEPPRGTYIAYSTSPGGKASDGYGSNGLYTKYLLKYMKMPGLSIEQVFKRVRSAVIHETGEQGFRQEPWESSSLTGDFYFVSPPEIRRRVPVPRTDEPKESLITIYCNEEKASVFVDGEFRGVTPFTGKKISVGDHRIKVEKNGFETCEKMISVKEDMAVMLDIDMSPLLGNLFVQSFPEDSRVRILNIKPKFRQGIPLLEGNYLIEVTAKNHATVKQWEHVYPGRDNRISIRLEKADPISVQPEKERLEPDREKKPKEKPADPRMEKVVAAGTERKESDIKKENFGTGGKSRFHQNGDGTVTDFSTGLVWKKDDKEAPLTFDGAKKHIEQMNGMRFAGHSDWRIPTMNELFSLIPDKDKKGENRIPNLFTNPDGWFWSSDISESGEAWSVDFKTRRLYYRYIQFPHVLAVRSLTSNDSMVKKTAGTGEIILANEK